MLVGFSIKGVVVLDRDVDLWYIHINTCIYITQRRMTMRNRDAEKKKKIVTIRISDEQIKSIEVAKGENPCINTTDILISGINLLRILKEYRWEEDKSYEELLNALIIQDDILRCLAKPDNPQVDADEVKRKLNDSLKDNEKKIALLLGVIVNNMKKAKRW